MRKGFKKYKLVLEMPQMHCACCDLVDYNYGCCNDVHCFATGESFETDVECFKQCPLVEDKEESG